MATTQITHQDILEDIGINLTRRFDRDTTIEEFDLDQMIKFILPGNTGTVLYFQVGQMDDKTRLCPENYWTIIHFVEPNNQLITNEYFQRSFFGLENILNTVDTIYRQYDI